MHDFDAQLRVVSMALFCIALIVLLCVASMAPIAPLSVSSTTALCIALMALLRVAPIALIAPLSVALMTALCIALPYRREIQGGEGSVGKDEAQEEGMRTEDKGGSKMISGRGNLFLTPARSMASIYA
jgi:hypothetical protein